MSVLRALPLALGSLLAAVVAHAQSETVPVIFSEVFAPGQSRVVPKLEAPEIVRARLPLSPQVRSALNERATVAIALAPVVAQPVKHTWLEESTDAIMMKRFVVKEQREKKVEVESIPSYLMKVFTTGEIIPQRGSKPSLNWGLSEAQATGYGNERNTVRFELFARLRF